MAVRSFNGTSDDLHCEAGGMTGFTHGTFAVLFKSSSLTGLRALGSMATSGGGFLGMLLQSPGNTNLRWWTSGESGFAAGLVTTSYFFALVRKATGTATPRFSVYRYSTAAWVHGNGSTAQANFTALGSTGVIRMSVGAAEFFAGVVAARAVWNNALPYSPDATGDSAIEAVGFESAYQNWFDEAPSALWKFNQASVGDPILDDIGSSHQSSLVGTTVVTGDDPPGFDFTLTPPPAPNLYTHQIPLRRR